MAKAAEVASQITIPSRSLEMKSALGTRTPAVVPFQGNTRSFDGSTRFRSGNSPHGASSNSSSSSFKWSRASIAHCLPKFSNAMTCTGRAPSIDHMAASTAPVSEPGR